MQVLSPQSTPPSPSTSTPPANPSQNNAHGCCSGQENCDNCLKGGMPMKKEVLSVIVVLLIGFSTMLFVLFVNEKRQVSRLVSSSSETNSPTTQEQQTISAELPALKVITEYIDLPQPRTRGTVSVEQALATRRSRRVFSDQPVTMAQLGQVLWSAQGITDENGHRTAPSGRSLYPFTVYAIVRNVDGLQPGMYQYLPEKHQLGNLGIANAGDFLSNAGVQENSQQAPVVLVLSAAYGKMVEKYPNNSVEVTMLEGGHIGQNIYLQVEALNMSTVVTAGFNPATVGEAIKLDPHETIVYLVPFGHTGEEPATEE